MKTKTKKVASLSLAFGLIIGGITSFSFGTFKKQPTKEIPNNSALEINVSNYYHGLGILSLGFDEFEEEYDVLMQGRESTKYALLDVENNNGKAYDSFEEQINSCVSLSIAYNDLLHEIKDDMKVILPHYGGDANKIDKAISKFDASVNDLQEIEKNFKLYHKTSDEKFLWNMKSHRISLSEHLGTIRSLYSQDKMDVHMMLAFPDKTQSEKAMEENVRKTIEEFSEKH